MSEPIPAPVLILRVNLDSGPQELPVFEDLDAFTTALAFCQQHGLPDDKAEELAVLIEETLLLQQQQQQQQAQAQPQPVVASSPASPSASPSAAEMARLEARLLEAERRVQQAHAASLGHAALPRSPAPTARSPSRSRSPSPGPSSSYASSFGGHHLTPLTDSEPEPDGGDGRKRATRLSRPRTSSRADGDLSSSGAAGRRLSRARPVSASSAAVSRHRAKSAGPASRAQQRPAARAHANGDATTAEGRAQARARGSGDGKGTGGKTVFDRLHADHADKAARLAAAQEEREREEEAARRASMRAHSSMGPDDGIARADAELRSRVPVGDRLYANAKRQQADLAARAEARRKELDAREAEGFTFAPSISERARSIQRSGPAWERLTEMGREREERLLHLQESKKREEPTYSFRPQLNPTSEAIAGNRRPEGALHERLFREHQERRARQEELQRRHLEQFPFRPTTGSATPRHRARSRSHSIVSAGSCDSPASEEPANFLERLESYSERRRQRAEALAAEQQGFFRVDPRTGRRDFQPFFSPARHSAPDAGPVNYDPQSVYRSEKRPATPSTPPPPPPPPPSSARSARVEAEADAEAERAERERGRAQRTEDLVRAKKEALFRKLFEALAPEEETYALPPSCRSQVDRLPPAAQPAVRAVLAKYAKANLPLPTSSRAAAAGGAGSALSLEQLSQLAIGDVDFGPEALFGLGKPEPAAAEDGAGAERSDEAPGEERHELEDWSLSFPDFCALLDKELARNGRSGHFLSSVQQQLAALASPTSSSPSPFPATSFSPAVNGHPAAPSEQPAKGRALVVPPSQAQPRTKAADATSAGTEGKAPKGRGGGGAAPGRHESLYAQARLVAQRREAALQNRAAVQIHHAHARGPAITDSTTRSPEQSVTNKTTRAMLARKQEKYTRSSAQQQHQFHV